MSHALSRPTRRPTRRTRLAPRALLLALAALATACGGQAPPAAAQAPTPRLAPTVGPMDISGQKVLVLPVQSVSGIPQTRADATREALFALAERNARVRWVDPDMLRSALRRSPGYADDPDFLPSDAFRHHHERYVVEPLGGLLRRYSALMDTRMALILQSAEWLPAAAGGGAVRMAAVVVDTRTGNVVWYGEADGANRPEPDAAALASAASALAGRMLVPGQ
ncbi:hypothetical protein [Longimicrobium sp.]|uniref:hypothetical protein n=1 Tax=Longimicrobium sp. TaxID=2029185 RepID=UPI002C66A80F|nr:hypothetical protein [Longimicrobium sp.]HSU13267.1 hypothetical protein [Longimicrobium sp.]